MKTNPTQYHPFHLAIPTSDLSKSKQFYGQLLGCPQGRTDPEKWIDYNFYGHQLVCHFATSSYVPKTTIVEGLPVPNFGLHLSKEQFEQVKGKLDNAKIDYQMIDEEIAKKKCLYVKDLTGNNIVLYLKAE